jgi:predicted transglutaminase-like cysteine proteinase
LKQEIIKGGRSWVNARTKVLRSKINRNRQLIKSSTDKTQITIWETEIEEWTWEITYITEIFTSSEVQNIIRKRAVVKRPVQKRPKLTKTTVKKIKKVNKIVNKATKKVNKLKF